jgi:wyosine [tRNA(Phe)-imidazoG37] synthetase (radical SAM superfamily)
LHSGFEKVLEFIRSKTTIAAVLLTNGTMLKSREVREAAACATW